MKGADTNLIVRFLVKDEENQAQKVKHLLDDGEILFINNVVLFELYWVLIHVYNYSKNDFVIALDALLDMRNIRFPDHGEVSAALGDYIHSNVGFVDCLIHRINKNRDLNTLTLIKKHHLLRQCNYPNS